MIRLRAAVTLAAVGMVLPSPGCARPPAPDDTPAPAAAESPPPPASAVPVDHLAPGELVEGPDKAFGVPLPREVRVEWNHPGSVRALGPVSVHALVKYFRTRVAEAHRTEGDTFAELDDVRLGGNPGHVFRIRMTELPPRGTLLELDDVTPPPAPDLPNEEARWRQVGLTPQGKVLDPTHF
jgi:hypothetical protein